MNLYLTVRNYHEKEIGIAFRWTGDDIEFNHYYDRWDTWRPTSHTKEEIMEGYYYKDYYECMWYTEESYRAMLTMKELVG